MPNSPLSPHLSTNHLKRFKRKQYTAQEYISGILQQNRMFLGRAITLLESQSPKHQQLGQEIVEQALQQRKKTIRIGITGTPGVGKSTFIEKFGLALIEQGHQVAVLAIDPSSQRSKGSILGDKTRMQELSVHPSAFVRPSPAGDSLGGVARKTREGILLCEAAGFDIILVETVGVGQSETAVHSMVDFFLLLLLPNSGDELQGIKRGVMEMADMVVINKADGNAVPQAKIAQQQCRNALHLFPPKESAWTAKAVRCSALEGTGIDNIWKEIQRYYDLTAPSGYFNHHRQQQALYWLNETIEQRLGNLFYQNPVVQEALKTIQQQVLEHEISPFKAGEMLLDIFYQQLRIKE